jgi:hypothetical protein
MGWIKDQTRTLRELGRSERLWLAAAASAAGACVSLLWASLGPDVSDWPKYLPAIGLAALAAILLFVWLLSGATKLHKKLVGVTNLEQALDTLSTYFNDANQNLFNRRIHNDTEYGTWRADWKRWQKEVEDYLERNLGLRERNIFRNIVLFEEKWIKGSYIDSQQTNEHGVTEIKSRHNFDRNILYRQLESIRATIIRHSDRAAKWRAEDI